MARRRRSRRPAPIGVILAGGEGRRMGGDKAVVQLGGRPLLEYPLSSVRAVLRDVAVVCKRPTVLPLLDEGVAIWLEDDEPCHPLAGVLHALRRAGGRPVMVVAGDMPFVTEALVVALVGEDAGGTPAVVPRAGGRLHALCARYEPAALDALAGFDARARPSDCVAAIGPRVLDWPDEDAFFTVTRPEDLLRAAARLDRG